MSTTILLSILCYMSVVSVVHSFIDFSDVKCFGFESEAMCEIIVDRNNNLGWEFAPNYHFVNNHLYDCLRILSNTSAVPAGTIIPWECFISGGFEAGQSYITFFVTCTLTFSCVVLCVFYCIFKKQARQPPFYSAYGVDRTQEPGEAVRRLLAHLDENGRNRRPYQEGDRTVEYLHGEAMQAQAKAELEESDLKRDRKRDRSAKLKKDSERTRQALEKKIEKLVKSRERVEAAMLKRRNARDDAMENHSDSLSDFARVANDLMRTGSQGVWKWLVNPEYVRIFFTTAMHIETALRQDCWANVIRVVLLYVERVVPSGEFMRWADFVSTFLLASTDMMTCQAGRPSFSEFLESDLLVHLKKVISVMVGIGLVPAAGLTLSPAGLKLFTFKNIEACSSVEDLFQICVSTLNYFATTGRKFFQSGCMTDLLFEDRSKTIIGLMEECSRLHERMSYEVIDLDDFLIKIKLANDMIYAKSKKETEVGKAVMLRHLQTIEGYKTEVLVRQRMLNPKEAPMAFNVWGESSVGKSSVAHFIIMALAKAYGRESFIGSTAFINSATKHDDAFNPNVEFVVEDDVNWDKQELAEKPQGGNAMDLVNNFPKMTSQAELSKKGVVQKKAMGYLCTSNSEEMFLRSFNYKPAIFRRILSIQVKLKAGAKTPSGELNSSFVKACMNVGTNGAPTCIPDDVWLISMCKYNLSTGMYEPLAYNSVTDGVSTNPPAGDMNWQMLVDVDLSTILIAIRSAAKTHQDIQKGVVDFLSAPMASCPHSDFPSLCRVCIADGSSTANPPPTFPANVVRRASSLIQPIAAPVRNSGTTSGLSLNIAGLGRMQSHSRWSDMKDAAVRKGTTWKHNVAVRGSLMMKAAPMGLVSHLSLSQKLRIAMWTEKLWVPLLSCVLRYTPDAATNELKIYSCLVGMLLIVCALCLPLLWVSIIILEASNYSKLYAYGGVAFLVGVLCYWIVAMYCIGLQAAVGNSLWRVRKERWESTVAAIHVVKSDWKFTFISVVTAGIGLAFALRRKFGNNMSAQSFNPPYEASCPWKLGSVKTIPAAEMKTGTLEHLECKLSLHLASIVGATSGGNMIRCHAIPYRDGLWVTNLHFLQEIEGLPLSWNSGGNTRNIVVTRKDWIKVDGDVALVFVRFPSMPDFSKYYTQVHPTANFPGKWMLKEMDGNVTIRGLRVEPLDKSKWSLLAAHNSYAFLADIGVESKVGMCGAAVISAGEDCLSIVGMHGAGYTGTGSVGILGFVQADLEAKSVILTAGKVMTPHAGEEITLLGKKVEYDASKVPEKSSVKHIDEGYEECFSNKFIVYGDTNLGSKTEKLRGFTRKSPIFEALSEEFGNTTHGPSKCGQPEWVSSQPALRHTGEDHLYEPDAYECSMVAMEKYYLDAQAKGVFKGIEPFTIEEVVKGIDSRPYVNGLNFKSGAGIPRDKSKMHFSFIDEDDKRMVTQEIVDEVLYLWEELQIPGSKERIIGEFKYKDEATKLVVNVQGKLVPKASRVYVCYPVAFQIVMAMVYGPLAEAMNYCPFDVGACVGLDVCSHDAVIVSDIATKHDAEHIVDGDFAHYDQSSTPEVTARTMTVDLEIARREGYPLPALRVMEGIVSMLTFPYILVNGVLTVIPGMTTSGHGFTIHSNNKITRFYLGYGFYSRVLKLKPPILGETLKVESRGKVLEVPYFYDCVSVVTQGDDHIGSPRAEYRHLFNMNTLQQDLADVNIGYTDANKSAVTKEFDAMYSKLGHSWAIPLSEENAEFLKRRFVKVSLEVDGVLYNTVACPINVKSIMKSLYWKGSFEKPTIWLNQVVGGAAREAFFYGEEVYLEFTSRLEKVLRESEYIDYIDDLPSYHQLLVKYAKTLRQCNAIKGKFELSLGGPWEMMEEKPSRIRSSLCVEGENHIPSW